jgi:Abnormal spindle-like microcephaly-assoc'd, ASPM-SPD-2-Hydin
VLFHRPSASAVRSHALLVCLAGLSLLVAGCASYGPHTPPTEPNIALSALSFNFKTVVVGQSSTQTLQLTNSGNAPLQITSISLSNKEFAISGPSLPRSVLPAITLDYTLTFSPTTPGNASASLTIKSNAPQSLPAISLAGVAEKVVVSLQVTPSSISFGNQNVQSTSTKNVTVQNTGDVSITISGVTSVGSGFGYSGLSPGVSLSPNQQITFQVWFRPQTGGTAIGTVSILSPSLPSPDSVSLSGAGVSATTTPTPPPPPPTQYTVHLTWDASSSAVVGYRVYRSTSSGTSYSPLFSTPLNSLTYSDSTVTDSSTYYYVVTSVDSDGVESTYSNQATADVPAS